MADHDVITVKAFKTKEALNTWLMKHHTTSAGIWLMFAKKQAEKQTISYAEALDVALCFGWIDGQKKPYDEQYWLQKFAPRKPKSIWSKKNIANAERLIKEEKMKPAGLKAIDEAKANGSWQNAYDAQSQMTIPEDFLKTLRRNKKAFAFFKTLNRTNLFSIAFRLQTAKKEETKQKRMQQIISMLENGQKFH